MTFHFNIHWNILEYFPAVVAPLPGWGWKKSVEGKERIAQGSCKGGFVVLLHSIYIYTYIYLDSFSFFIWSCRRRDINLNPFWSFGILSWTSLNNVFPILGFKVCHQVEWALYFWYFWSIFINLKQLLRSQVDPPKAAAANAHGSKAANVSWYEVKSVIL